LQDIGDHARLRCKRFQRGRDSPRIHIDPRAGASPERSRGRRGSSREPRPEALIAEELHHDLSGGAPRRCVDRHGLARPARQRACRRRYPRPSRAVDQEARIPTEPECTLPCREPSRGKRHRLSEPVGSVLLGGHLRLRT
jgi:hypothetical protein